MMQEFTKYQGTGNDFILIDNRSQRFKKEQAPIARLCHRRFGIGADGLILLENAVKTDNDFRMVYYNADGNEGTMCGNGGRCVVHFANKLGIIAQNTRFEAIDGLHEAQYSPSHISLKLGNVRHYENHKEAYILNTGSPHFVQFVQNLDQMDVQQEGKKIRYSPEFKEEGINVNFVECGNDFHFIRTYERGVEAETLSCGTGAVAAAIASTLHTTKSHSPIRLKTLGGILQVAFKKEPYQFSDIWLIGPAKEVFTGVLKYPSIEAEL